MAEYDCHRFSGLELLPTPMLEKIIEQDFKQEADYDPELIDYVLALMLQRAKNEDPHSIPDVQSSWNKLQQRLGSEVELGSLPFSTIPTEKSRKTTRTGPFLRYVAVVAACIALIFGAMITAQAMGVDVFGVLAQWTDSTFRFDSNQEPNENINISEGISPVADELQKALSDTGIHFASVPTWIPEGYSLSFVDHVCTKDYKGVYATYSNPNTDNNIVIELKEYLTAEYLTSGIYEKSFGTPESYIKNGKQFYLFKNNDFWTFTWSDGRYSITVIGIESRNTAIEIINSIQDVRTG